MSMLNHARYIAASRLQADRVTARITQVFRGTVAVDQVIELPARVEADVGAELLVIEHIAPQHRHGDPPSLPSTMTVIDPRRDPLARGDIERAAKSAFRVPPSVAPYLESAGVFGPLYVDFLVTNHYPWPLLERMLEDLPGASRATLRFALDRRPAPPTYDDEDDNEFGTTRPAGGGWFPLVRVAVRACAAALAYPFVALGGDTRAFLYSTWTNLAAIYIKPIRFRACTSAFIKYDDRSQWIRNSTHAETKAWFDNHQVRWRPCNLEDRTWVPIVFKIVLNGDISILDWPAPHFDDGTPNTPDPRPPGQGGNIDASNWQQALADLRAYNTANGGRGKWHSEAATEAHERYHWEQEWIEGCVKRHLPQLLADIAPLQVQADTEADARTRLEPLMQLPISAYTLQCMNEWSKFQELDEPGTGAGYGAGQAVLDQLIRQIEAIAANAGW